MFVVFSLITGTSTGSTPAWCALASMRTGTRRTWWRPPWCWRRGRRSSGPISILSPTSSPSLLEEPRTRDTSATRWREALRYCYCYSFIVLSCTSFYFFSCPVLILCCCVLTNVLSSFFSLQVPEWVLDHWHPSEKAMYPDYFSKREHWKQLRLQSWDKEVSGVTQQFIKKYISRSEGDVPEQTHFTTGSKVQPRRYDTIHL